LPIKLCLSQGLLNLDFESELQGTDIPAKGIVCRSDAYIESLDDIEKYSLSRSVKIESNNPAEGKFATCTGVFPIDLVRGKNIEFTGKIKTENIENGWAGLWWRVDGMEGKVLGFDNMSDRGLRGTNDWTNVSINMKVDEKGVLIAFGGLFVGNGVAWFDNFEIYIEGKKYIDL